MHRDSSVKSNFLVKTSYKMNENDNYIIGEVSQ